MKVFLHITWLLVFTILMGCGKSAVQKKSTVENKDSASAKEASEVNTLSIKNDTIAKDPSGQEILSASFDSSRLVIDTMIQHTSYKLVVGKDKYNSSHHQFSIDDLEFNPLMVYILKGEQDSIVYQQKFEENQFVTLFSFKESTAEYISLSTYSGGSGYMSNIYKIEWGDAPMLKKVFNYHELTAYLFNTDGSQILYMQAIWDMTDEDESHFSDHTYDIGIVDISHNKVDEKIISTTRHKYPSADYDFSAEKLLKMIHQKEPHAFKGINLDKYLVQ